MQKFTLYRASQKTGKVNVCLEGLSKAMLALWALQNTTPTTVCFIVDETGLVHDMYTGTKEGWPVVERGITDEGLYIEEQTA